DDNSLENTVSGWQSVRYLAATPGETVSYRLAASADNGQTWVYSEAVSVTNPKPIVELHSRPSAKKTIYLDFNGHIDDYDPHVVTMQKTFKLETSSYPELAAKNYIEIQPFFFRGAFYNAEKGTTTSEVYPVQYAVEDIWRMVAEDFAIFDVNVTTVEPPYDALVKSSEEDDVYGKRVILDPAYDRTADNTRIWYPGAGGQSCLSSFGFRADRPVYVFGSASRQAIASQTTHEVSHTFGLTHDSGTIYFGKNFSSTAYYQGVAFTENATMKWYPVLGAVPSPRSYNECFYDSGDFINQFSNGNYSSATNIEDDFAVILGLVKGDAEKTVVIDTKADLYSIATRNLTLVEDEAGDTPETALLLSDDSIIGSSSHTRTGVIGKHIVDSTTKNDVDCYTFALASAGTLSVSAIPSFDGHEEGASLDAGVELLNAQGAVLYRSESGTATADIRHATLTNLSLAAGTYTVRVYGTYHPVELAVVPEDSTETNWYPNATSNYGSVGPYSLNLTLTGTTFSEPTIEVLSTVTINLAEVQSWSAFLETLSSTQQLAPTLTSVTLLCPIEETVTFTFDNTTNLSITSIVVAPADTTTEVIPVTLGKADTDGTLTIDKMALSNGISLSTTTANLTTGEVTLTSNATLILTTTAALGYTSITGEG
ncbi:MAG: PPC domain-containing protein, partial [bacterium]|nr:PPC domain-containing protein [bacterium]